MPNLVDVLPPTSHSIYSEIAPSPPDPILGLTAAYNSDPATHKLNLSIGVYSTPGHRAYTPASVCRAMSVLVADPADDHRYLPIDGYESFTSSARRLVLGSAGRNRTVSVQTLSGTGALRVGLELLWEVRKEAIDEGERAERVGRMVYIANPTWENHVGIIEEVGWGNREIRRYRYWDVEKKGLDVEGMIEDLKRVEKGSVVVVQGCAHNPTGADLEVEDWVRVGQIARNRKLVLLIDVAYQGWAGGGMQGDMEGIRRLVEAGVECLVCQSFSKGMGLYGQRVGALHVVVNDVRVMDNVRGMLKRLIRSMYSSPPAFGAKVAALVLNNERLFKQWEEELNSMVQTIRRRRTMLVEELNKRFGKGHKWDFLARQKGMFAFLDLSKEQVSYLRRRHHIYLANRGRLSLASLPEDMILHFVEALFGALK